jgi:uncharacterized membrane protein YczE
MKPVYIVLSINLAIFAILGLTFTVLKDRPELIPLFTSVQAAFNLLGMFIFILDKKKSLWVAFLVGVLMVAAATAIGYMVLFEWIDTIGFEEGYTM